MKDGYLLLIVSKEDMNLIVVVFELFEVLLNIVDMEYDVSEWDVVYVKVCVVISKVFGEERWK